LRFSREYIRERRNTLRWRDVLRADETDIDKLTAELVNVVNETMQPKNVSLWLKKEEIEKW